MDFNLLLINGLIERHPTIWNPGDVNSGDLDKRFRTLISTPTLPLRHQSRSLMDALCGVMGNSVLPQIVYCKLLRSSMQGDFKIGGCLVRPRLNAIDFDETTIHLEPKVMRVLVALATQAGEVVTRQQLRETVWQDVFVGEDVLVRAISELRRAFQDDPRSQHTIQTVPKVGYRLVAPVQNVESSPMAPAEDREESLDKADLPPSEGEDLGNLEGTRQIALARWRPWALVGGVLVLFLGTVVGLWNVSRRQGKNEGRETAPSSLQTDQVKAYREQAVASAQGGCPILTGATYVLENKKTGSVLEVPVSSASNGTLLDEWKNDGGNNQRWVVEANGPYWTFTNVASGKLLDVPSANRAPGVQVDQWQSNHAANQSWIAIPVGDNSCKIISQSSGLLLDVNQSSAANGTAVIQYTDNDGANQHWIFRLVNKPTEARLTPSPPQ
jgi:DNA-binding winged helix-turn-helix (wHTH) protein